MLGEGVQIHGFVNLYGCTIGDGTRLGTFVEVQKGASIGARCKISSHTFVCEGVEIEDGVFVGHGVMFTNTMLPRATNAAGELQTEADWEMLKTRIGRRGAGESRAPTAGQSRLFYPLADAGDEALESVAVLNRSNRALHEELGFEPPALRARSARTQCCASRHQCFLMLYQTSAAQRT